MNQKNHILFIFVLVALATASRLLPHPNNFTPLLAIALFAGRQLPGRFSSLGLVAVSMLAIDLPLIFTQILPQSGAAILPKIVLVNVFVYGTVLGTAMISNRVRAVSNWQTTLLGSLAASLAFFLATNLASWMAFYPLSWSSLVQCYVNAVPFFKNTWLSTLLYSAAFYLALEARHRWEQRQSLRRSTLAAS